MKIDKDSFLIAGLIVGAVVCSPFIGIYYGMKWIYQIPKQKRIRKEIKELESQLGLVGRLTRTFDYDPYYYKRNSSRKEYLESLKKKVSENYQSPDIIFAIQETKTGMLADLMEYSGKCQVLMLANKNFYDTPLLIAETIMSPYLKNADEYFKYFYKLMEHAQGIEGRLRTLSECGKYEDYFVVEIPGEFEYREVGMGNETIKQFVEDFKKKYRKQDK